MACYLTAVDKCYAHLCQKVDKLQSQSREQRPNHYFSLADIDHCVMHVSKLSPSFLSAKGFKLWIIRNVP